MDEVGLGEGPLDDVGAVAAVGGVDRLPARVALGRRRIVADAGYQAFCAAVEHLGSRGRHSSLRGLRRRRRGCHLAHLVLRSVPRESELVSRTGADPGKGMSAPRAWDGRRRATRCYPSAARTRRSASSKMWRSAGTVNPGSRHTRSPCTRSAAATRCRWPSRTTRVSRSVPAAVARAEVRSRAMRKKLKAVRMSRTTRRTMAKTRLGRCAGRPPVKLRLGPAAAAPGARTAASSCSGSSSAIPAMTTMARRPNTPQSRCTRAPRIASLQDRLGLAAWIDGRWCAACCPRIAVTSASERPCCGGAAAWHRGGNP